MRIIILIVTIIFASCTYTQKIKDGEMAYDRKQFSVAIHMLTDEFDRTEYPELKARKAYLLAESYNEINDIPNAIEWYKQAFDLKYGDKALEKLAYALKKNEQYVEAVRVFQAVQERVGNSPQIAREITECTNASQWLAEKENSPYEVSKLAQNSEYSDYAPQIFEGSQLVFTSDRKSNENEDIYNWTGLWFSDLYIVNQFSKEVIPFDSRINSEHNDGTATFNSDYTEIIFTRCESQLDDDYCKLMSATRSGSSWTDPEPLDFIEDRINYGHPTLHENDSILFYSAQIEEGFGGYDIYYVQRLENGWTVPQILGAGVNTIGHEKFPFIDRDTLYFSSDGWPGMGGLDIFRTYVQADGSWSRVENMRPPINSGADDFGFVIDVERRANTGELTGYFTSSRKESARDDIYAFASRIVSDPVSTEEVADEVDTKNLQLYLAIKTNQNKYLVQSDPLSGVTGREDLQNVSVQVNGRQLNSGEKGLLVIDILPSDDLEIVASKEGYLSKSIDFKPTKIPEEGEKTYTVSLLLEPIVTGVEFELENIYYDLDEYFIREDAKPSLNELAELLENNPDIEIELNSHTDCRGKDDYNITLSQNRAQAAVNYLVSQGIDQERLSARGFGDTRPAINCYCETCTEEEHQENRRTTFKIVSY
ncbi:OmpA family protein [Portibacter marinus]|uniref:OmpA family protein n=1 Tax=Portibacter marinus TaxID=2898660 RepID=UPI001F418FB6|nr:OmpA family protein [Portibacter marinus]